MGDQTPNVNAGFKEVVMSKQPCTRGQVSDQQKHVTRYVLVASVGEDDTPVVDLCIGDDDGYSFVREAKMGEEFVCAYEYDQDIKILAESKENSTRIDREHRERMQSTIDRLVDERDEQAATLTRLQAKISEFIGEESYGEPWPPEADR